MFARYFKSTIGGSTTYCRTTTKKHSGDDLKSPPE